MSDNQPYNLSEHDINLNDIFITLWKAKIFIFIITTICSIAAVSYALYLPDIYKSSSILAPTQQSVEGSRFDGSLSGIASLAGINLPSSEGDITLEATQTLTSYKFFVENILPNIYLPNLMAVKSWNRGSNTIIYDDAIFNSTNEEWLRAPKPPRGPKPSNQEAYEAFSKIFTLNINEETLFYTISVEHQSPYIAKEWADLLIRSINETLREDKKNRTTLSINYLNKQVAKIGFTEVKTALAQLIQRETEKLMTIESNPDYIFKQIDPPIVSELKSKPARALISIIGFIFGLFLGAIIIIVRNYSFGVSDQSQKVNS